MDAHTWENVQNVTLSEMNQSQKDKDCVVLLKVVIVSTTWRGGVVAVSTTWRGGVECWLPDASSQSRTVREGDASGG